MNRGLAISFVLFCSAAGILCGGFVPALAGRPSQPIRFNHWLHVYNGVECKTCHVGAERNQRAGLPSVTTCRLCHEDVLYEAPEEAKIRTTFEAGRDLSWRHMNRLQSYVYFSHRRHVTLGERSCELCHGDVSAWHKPPQNPEVRFSGRPGMAACISCHEESQDSYAGTDCLDCHR